MQSVVLVTLTVVNHQTQVDTVMVITDQVRQQLDLRVQLALQLLIRLNQYQRLNLNQPNQLVIARNQRHLAINLNQLRLVIVHLVRRQVAHHQALKLHTEGNNQCSETS